MKPWDPAEERPKIEDLWVRDVQIRKEARSVSGRGPADIFDLALEGMTATVASIEQDFEGRVYVTVTVDDDPGKDFGEQRKPAHRFFFWPEEIEPL